MKVCILYTGAYNLSEYSLENHKKNLFAYLKKNDIQFDVFISVANELYFTNFDKELDETNLKIFKNLQKKKPKLPNMKYNENWRWQSQLELNPFEIKQNYERIVGKNNIKYFDTTNCEYDQNYWQKNEYPKNYSRDTHFIEGVLNSNFYARSCKLFKKIKKENYDYFIQLRPEYMFYKEFEFLSIVPDKPNFLFYCSHRLDFLYISDFLFDKFINFKKFNKYRHLFEKDKLPGYDFIPLSSLPDYLKIFNINCQIKSWGDKISFANLKKYLPLN